MTAELVGRTPTLTKPLQDRTVVVVGRSDRIAQAVTLAAAEYFADISARNPARRIGTAQDVADAVLFALTNTFLTGVTLAVDGGEPLT